MQRPHKYSESWYGGKTKRNKAVKLDNIVKESNIMEHDAPITKKNKENNWLKSARVKVLKQIQKAWKILIVLTTLQLVKKLKVYMTLNDSLRNIW